MAAVARCCTTLAALTSARSRPRTACALLAPHPQPHALAAAHVRMHCSPQRSPQPMSACTAARQQLAAVRVRDTPAAASAVRTPQTVVPAVPTAARVRACHHSPCLPPPAAARRSPRP
ncbi:hypothetical protein PVAP13_3NG203430 [Panicum virgatum]|uniref:Uncharacterized protein n=1 Tax=Panicum virgatum TaxID=38727 RepID=A0A8T0UFC2_PANVG|nr:hypothetical protein PVAP13_3NG203430 [Panicum virgatum]